MDEKMIRKIEGHLRGTFANARINVRHAWETLWWEWILNLRGLLYYSKDAGHSYTNAIYLLGNKVDLEQFRCVLPTARLIELF